MGGGKVLQLSVFIQLCQWTWEMETDRGVREHLTKLSLHRFHLELTVPMTAAGQRMTDKKCHVIAYFTLWKLAYEYNLSPYLILRFNYDITSITIDHLKVILLFLESVSRSMRFIIVKFAINIHNLSYNTNQFEKLFQRALQLNNNKRKKTKDIWWCRVLWQC